MGPERDKGETMTRRRGRKLITSDEARVTKRQHALPCSDCPWDRCSLPGWLAGLSPEQWIAAAHGDEIMECHTAKDASGTPWQCAGAAIYRANTCKAPRDPNALRLQPNRDRVFSWPTEFHEHHTNEPESDSL